MKIETSMFGTIDVLEDQEIRFVQAMIGFPGLVRFVLMDTGGAIKWLQSLDDEAVVFPVVDPFGIKADYDVEIPTSDAKALQLENVDDVQLWCVTVLADSKEEVRANLRAPIVLNQKTGKARQIVLPDNDLPIRYRFLPETIESNKEVADYAGANA
ncbi:MAG: flagellar assembly protein FliW [Planctomycetes bacterium]|nr:flagellar assembly protein FliW [Planctomycetota bacterium]